MFIYFLFFLTSCFALFFLGFPEIIYMSFFSRYVCGMYVAAVKLGSPEIMYMKV